MSRAFISVCKATGCKVEDGPQARALAMRIIEAARRGERDPEKLKASALKALRH
ncbi:MAG TPA: hypothetical protein VKX28_06960 [Xanthobacteraceae bacterium]|nr:hypothetical protein [Xanthobacteraceae bacterium]